MHFKHVVILICVLTLVTSCNSDQKVLLPHGDCAKEITSPARFAVALHSLACKEDSDCTLSQEGCRSCTCPIAAPKGSIAEIDDLDRSLRELAQDVRTCEACSTERFEAQCIEQVCTTVQKKAL
jgi:hypothetical protein